jgi:hypothetical protein
MNTNRSGRAARVRANQRLHNLTVGTAILGFAATGAFGALAAFTYNGTTPTTSNTAFTSTGTSTSSTTQGAPAVTTTTRIAHVSSGGS